MGGGCRLYYFIKKKKEEFRHMEVQEDAQLIAQLRAEVEDLRRSTAEAEEEAKIREMQSGGQMDHAGGAMEAPRYNNTLSVFVSRLSPHGVTAKALAQHLSGGHEALVTRCELLTWPNGSPRGHAYLEFANAEARAKALEKNGSEFLGTTIGVVPKTGGEGRPTTTGRGGRGGMPPMGRGRGSFTTPSQQNAMMQQFLMMMNTNRGRGGGGRGRPW